MPVQERYPQYMSDQRELFDQLIVEDWETYRSPAWDASRRYEVRQALGGIGQGARVLDVGCGCGFHAQTMARSPLVAHVDAIDYSEKSIERARRSYDDPKVTWKAVDFEEFEGEGPYDLVTSFQVIEHLEDPVGFLRRCGEHCRTGGRVAAFTVHRMRPYNRKRARYGKEPEMEDPMHFQEFELGELERIGEEAGLRTLRGFHYYRHPLKRPYGLWLWAGRLFPFWAERIGIVYGKVQ